MVLGLISVSAIFLIVHLGFLRILSRMALINEACRCERGLPLL